MTAGRFEDGTDVALSYVAAAAVMVFVTVLDDVYMFWQEVDAP